MSYSYKFRELIDTKVTAAQPGERDALEARLCAAVRTQLLHWVLDSAGGGMLMHAAWVDAGDPSIIAERIGPDAAKARGHLTERLTSRLRTLMFPQLSPVMSLELEAAADEQVRIFGLNSRMFEGDFSDLAIAARHHHQDAVLCQIMEQII